MSPGALFKIAGGKGGQRPPLSARQIASIPELLDEAAAIYKLPDASSVIVLSTEWDASGNPIVVCVRPRLRYGVRHVNAITTAFGKDNATAWAMRNSAALQYVGEKTNPRLPLPGLIYHQTGARETEGSGRIVLGPRDLRNYRARMAAAAFSTDPTTSKQLAIEFD